MRSPHVCALTGLSFRQVDYLTRNPETGPLLARAVPPLGGGNYRSWPADVVRRLMVAAHVQRARGDTTKPGRNRAGGGPLAMFPGLTAAVLRGPRPPDAGWLILGGPGPTSGAVAYALDAVELVDRIAERRYRCQAVDYDLHAIALEHGVADLDEVLAGAVPVAWLTPTQRRSLTLTGAL